MSIYDDEAVFRNDNILIIDGIIEMIHIQLELEQI